MRFGGEPGLVQDNGASFEVGERERARQQVEFCWGKPGKGFEAAQVVEVGGTMAFEFIQFFTIRMIFQLYAFGAHKRNRCYLQHENKLPQRTRRMCPRSHSMGSRASRPV